MKYHPFYSRASFYVTLNEIDITLSDHFFIANLLKTKRSNSNILIKLAATIVWHVKDKRLRYTPSRHQTLAQDIDR